MQKVLIVDNSSYMRMFVKKTVEKGGDYAVLEASGKDEAMDMFKNENPNLVILDLNMSETTMEGIDVLSDMIENNPETAVIVVSAVGHEEVKEKCLKLGAKAYVRKPIDTDVLLNALKEYI